MKALLDEHISPQIGELLRELGYDVVAVADRDDLVAQNDRNVFEIACREDRAVVTNNVKDFRPLAAGRLASGHTHSGLILLPSSPTRTRGAIGALTDAIASVLSEHPEGLPCSERWIGPP